ncbi:unnamed protein product [Parnassius apollo]|uniref:(apollo) hypothetical protein n=1 Tax=Parnassius apollo TaxID=110799 RepID=A0A8S3XUZ8_PARAO|nr:unnamed protein product [Parnassius apollo]
MPKMLRSPPCDTLRIASNPELASNITQRENKRRRTSDADSETEIVSTDAINELKTMLETFVNIQNTRLDNIEKKLALVTNQNVIIQQTNSEIEKSINFVSDRIDNLQKDVSNIEKDRKALESQINTINTKFDALEKYIRKTSIEIRNVPKIRGENRETLFKYAHTLITNLNVSMEQKNLRDVYRLPSKADATSSTIVAELGSSLHRSQVIDAVKRYTKDNPKDSLNCNHMGIMNVKSSIYVSEHLTTKSKRLYFLARDIAKTMGYSYYWTSNDNVYLRRKEGDPHILIRNESQLSELKILSD